MKRRVQLLLTCLVMAAVLTGCQAAAEPHEGEAEGYGGTLRVRVRTNGTDVTAVEVIEHHETEGVGTRAIDVMPDAIVRSDTPDVDGVSGATRTSDAIRAAVRMALGQTATPSSMDAPTASPARRSGVGMAASAHAPREGSSDQGFSVVVASADFDAEGRILSVMMDEMEIVTPGGSENRPAFSGFPTDDGDQERFRQEVASFTSKRAQGDAYRMPKGTWAEQMDAYAEMMKGKTIEEVEAWFAAHFDPETGYPLTEGEGSDPDILSQASISLSSPRADLLTALRRAAPAGGSDHQALPDDRGDTAARP